VLESTRGICQSKRCDEPFIWPESGAECGKPFVTLGNPELMECSNDVEFSKLFGSADSFKRLVYQWQRVTVLLCDLIQGAIVDTES